MSLVDVAQEKTMHDMLDWKCSNHWDNSIGACRTDCAQCKYRFPAWRVGTHTMLEVSLCFAWILSFRQEESASHPTSPFIWKRGVPQVEQSGQAGSGWLAVAWITGLLAGWLSGCLLASLVADCLNGRLANSLARCNYLLAACLSLWFTVCSSVGRFVSLLLYVRFFSTCVMLPNRIPASIWPYVKIFKFERILQKSITSF